MSWEQLQKEHAALQNDLQALEKYTKQADKMEHQLAEVEKEIAQYEDQLKKVQHTYDKLETRSIINFIRDFTGKREELIQENVEQIAQIELKLVEAKLMQKDLRNDLQAVYDKKNALSQQSVKEQLQELRVKMQVWLMSNAPQKSEQLTQLIDEELLAKRLLIEIEEAITAGLHSEECLRAATKKMREADAYSTWDLLGGGLIATALKHSALDDSNSSIHDVQLALQRFKNELLDIQEIRREEMYVNVDGIVQFADFVFDDIFSDWIVHSKIGKAKDQMNETLDDVIGTIHDLRMKQNVVMEKQQQLQQQKEEIFSQRI